MRKVAIFKFRATDCEYNPRAPHGQSSFSEIPMDISYAESVINDFIENEAKEVISVSPSVIDARFHNNGGWNTANIIYTVLYEEKER